LLPLTTAEYSNFKNIKIVGDDDDFEEVRMEKFLAGMRRVKDVFYVSQRNVRKEVWVMQGQNGKSKRKKTEK